MHDESLFSALADIINGYSFCKVKGQEAFIKHPDLKSELESSSVYNKYYSKYQERGLPTNEDRLAFLKEEGDWTEEDESFISKNKKFVQNLIKTRSKLVIKSQLEGLNKTIEEIQGKLSEKTEKRERLIGATCEKYANRKKEEVQILSSIFKDKEFTKPIFTAEEAEYLEPEEVAEVFIAYNSIFDEFKDEKIKKISIAPVFYNFFSLAEKENPSSVFGKPILSLTFFQQKLLHYAQNARYIYENVPNIPEEVREDYDSLVEFSKKEKVASKPGKSNSGYSIVGANKNEMEMAGVQTDGAVSPFDLLRKSGGTSLGKRDFVKMAESV